MSAQANLELVQNLYAAFGRGDVPAMLGMAAEDVEFGVLSDSDVPWHGVGKGHAQMVKFFTALGKETEFSRFEPHSFIAGENGVACLVELTATIKRNGNKVSMRDIHHFTIAGGKVTRWNGSEDTAKIEKAWFSR